MTHYYSVYLEIAEEGTCMAHVLDLPGCMVRARNREEAIAALPDAIREYHAWLRHHGEAAPPDNADSSASGGIGPIEVAGESIGTGPFDPGVPSYPFHEPSRGALDGAQVPAPLPGA